MESIVLEDGIEYYIIDTEIIDNIEYTMFSNINDDSDICFRKTITENYDKVYIGLDNENEFEKVFLTFTKKNLK